MSNFIENCYSHTTAIESKKDDTSLTLERLEIPDYLKISIESNSVISINSRDYLSLKCGLVKDNLLKIDGLTVSQTVFWIDSLRQTVEYYELWWDEPLVNISSDGEVVFEWWHENRKLTVYILQEEIDYIKVLGKDIDNDMEDGSISFFEDIKSLWEWISFK